MNGIEIPDERWHKSTYSDGQANCVEVALTPDTMAVRDSKNPKGPALTFTAEAWSSFVRGIADGEFAGA
jgi:hypothetical protein